MASAIVGVAWGRAGVVCSAVGVVCSAVGVASAVGLATIYIFGFKNERTKLYAESLGYALQFTNILRDVVDDARTLKRSYVPSCELEAFGVRKEDLADPSHNQDSGASGQMTRE